jgi:outer membrane protein OmpA-like peptidoglycan-associated protein
MKRFRIAPRLASFAAASALVATLFAAGCASKGYVRSNVSSSAAELAARMDEGDAKLQQQITSNTTQVEELRGVAAQNTQQLQTLDSGIKQTDTKAQQALGVGQEAKTTADRAAAENSRLEEQFNNRNRYSPVSEESVQFGPGSANLSDPGKQVLRSVAEAVKGNTSAILVLEGHTDSQGSEIENVALGDRRLDAVARHLVIEEGVPIYVIRRQSFGEAKPVAPNDTQDGRAQNRAVVIRILATETEAAGLR